MGRALPVRMPVWMKLTGGLGPLEARQESALAFVAAGGAQMRLLVPLFAALGPVLVFLILQWQGELPAGVAIATAIASTAGCAALALARTYLRRLHCSTIEPRELRELEICADDTGDRAYLELAQALLQVQPAPEAERRVREALGAFGAALQRLPRRAHLGPGIAAPPAALYREASGILQQAEGESDEVTAGALRRRAEAVQARAQLQERRELMLRRSQALLGEVEAQMRALADAVTTADAIRPDPAICDEAAHSARLALAEVDQVLSARDELDGNLPEQTEATILRIYADEEAAR